MPSISLPTIAAVAGTATAGIGLAKSLGGGAAAGQAPAGNTTTIQKADPWSGQQPYLLGGFGQAQNILNSGGAQYFPGETYAQPNAWQNLGLDTLAGWGAQPSPVENAASNAAANYDNGAYLYNNPGNQTYQRAANGGLNVNTGSLFSPIATGQYQNTAGVAPLSGIASGRDTNTAGMYPLAQVAAGRYQIPGEGTLGAFASGASASAENPYFQQMARTTAANVLPSVQAQFSSGRMDSGLASRAAGEGLGDAIGGLAYQNYQQGLQQQQGAATTLAGIGEQNVGNTINAAQDLGQFGQQNIANRMNASGMLAGIGQNNITNMLNASQALTNLGIANSGLQLTGAQGLSGNYNSATAAQLQSMGMSPNINTMPLAQIGALNTAGGQLQANQQSAIDDALKRWNYNQNLPANTLNNYMGEISGNYGGTTSVQQPYFENSAANSLATGLGIAQLGQGLSGIFNPQMQFSQTPIQFGSLGNGLTNPASYLSPVSNYLPDVSYG